MISPARFDVGIVGGGPAGARAAWRLCRSGARVVMFDGSHPREKPCGGGVTGRALELVSDAIDPAALPSIAITAATFEHGANITAVSVGDAVPFASAARRHVEARLRRHASRRGNRRGYAIGSLAGPENCRRADRLDG